MEGQQVNEPNKKKGKGLKITLIAFVGVVVLVALIGTLTGGLQPIEDEQEPPNTPVSTNPEQKEDVAPKYYVVGDSVETDNFVITVDDLKELEPAQYMDPAEGNIFYQVALTIENKGEKDKAISSLLDFDAYVDGYSVDDSIKGQVADDSLKTMNGTIAAGKKLKGQLVYEIPADWEELEIDIDLSTLAQNDKAKLTFKNA